MKKKIKYIIVITAGLLALLAINLWEGQVIDKSDLSFFNSAKVDNAVNQETASEQAEAINNITSDTVSEIAISEVLDNYYSEDEVDTDAVQEFSNTLEADITDTIQDYEDAKEERDNAEDLNYATEEILITVSEKATQEEIEEMVKVVSDDYEVISEDGTIIKAYLDLDQTTEKAIEEFSEYDIVENCFTNNYGSTDSLTSELTDSQADNEYYLDDCGFSEAWDIVEGLDTQNNVTVAVIDNGFYVNHYEIDDNIVDAVDITQKDDDGEYLSLYDSTKPLCSDSSHHGTFCASVIGAEPNNYAIAGAGTTTNDLLDLMLIKIYDTNDNCTSSNFYLAVKYAVDNGANVISCSISWELEDDVLEAAIKYAEDNGVVVCCSGGNTGENEYRYPSGYDTVISVGAINEDNEKASFSTYGQAINILTYGCGIYGADVSNTTSYRSGSGTSYSTPLVASTVALMLMADNTLTPREIRQILYETSSEVGSHTWKLKRTETNYCYICGEYTYLSVYVCKDSDCDAKKFVCANGHTYFEYSEYGCGILNAEFALQEVIENVE